jgi:hypothetical protein
MKKIILGLLTLLSINSVQAESSANEDAANTRFGEITFTENFTASFNGKEIDGVSFIQPHYLIGRFELKSSDVILYQEPGGSACAGSYSYIIVDNEGARTTPGFGTCYHFDVVPIQVGETVSFSMPKAGNEGAVLYSYQDGKVYEKDGVMMLNEDGWDIDYKDSTFLKK